MIPSARTLAYLVPALGLGFVLILLVRGSRGEEPETPAARPRRASIAPESAAAVREGGAAPREEPAPPDPAPAAEAAMASEDVRIESTYDNYRTAVVTGNEELAAALRPVLLQDRKVAVRLAQQELSEAADDADRALARKVLDSLGR